MRLVGSFSAALVFLHALVATPLFVECFQADGRYLVEILGNDPCHDFGLPTLVSGTSDTAVVQRAGGAADPCLDLLMENPGCTRACSDVPIQSIETGDSMVPVISAQLAPNAMNDCPAIFLNSDLICSNPSQPPLALRI